MKVAKTNSCTKYISRECLPINAVNLQTFVGVLLSACMLINTKETIPKAKENTFTTVATALRWNIFISITNNTAFKKKRALSAMFLLLTISFRMAHA